MKWKALLTSRKVWFALLGLAVAVSQAMGAEIPSDVFAAIETLIIALIAGIAIEDHGLRSAGK